MQRLGPGFGSFPGSYRIVQLLLQGGGVVATLQQGLRMSNLRPVTDDVILLHGGHMSMAMRVRITIILFHGVTKTQYNAHDVLQLGVCLPTPLC